LLTLTDAHSNINPSNGTACYDGSLEYNFSADKGYQILNVLVDGSPASVASPYTFTSVDNNHIIAVSTSIKTYT